MAIHPKRRQDILGFLAHPFWDVSNVSEPALVLYDQALTHNSYANERQDQGIPCEHYQRLEFLGDRILNHAVAEFLFHDCAAAEGVLTGKIQFTKNENLAQLAKAKSLGIHPPVLRLGNGQDLEDSIIADVFEAVVAAIYIDSDYGMAKIRTIVSQNLAEDIRAFQPEHENPKQDLQIFIQKHLRNSQVSKADLNYVVLSDTVDANNRHNFVVEVKILGCPWGRGQGSNTASAEQAAARAALSKIEAGDSSFPVNG